MSKRWALFTTAMAVPAMIIAAQVPPATQSEVLAAATASQVHFNAVGDFSSSTNAAAVLDRIASTDADLTMALGDLSYGVTGQEQAWCDFVTSRVGEGYPFEAVSGNHESNKANGYINDFATCLPNQLPGVRGTYGRQYYVDVPQADPLVRFIQVSPALTFPDGVYSYAAGTPRYAWTAQAIDGARAAQIPWVVVSMHKPCLSVGAYTCDQGPDLLNMLVDKRVDLVLTGHDHSYQRSKQLALSPGCVAIVPDLYDADCVADGDSSLQQGRGTVLAVVGTGGNSLYAVNATDPEAPYFVATSGGNKQPTWGPLDVTATPESLTATFLPAAGNGFTDAFEISRLTAPNAAPTATFTTSCTGPVCTFDGSASSDSDGTISSYAWDFGDGTTGSGVTPTHTYGTSGTFTARLTVTDERGSTGTTTRNLSVIVPNQPPSARFTSTSDGLVASFDSSSSSDADGSISSFTWDFGDGGTSSTPNPTHTYQSAGTYSVKLTVTDAAGATDSVTHDIVVSAGAGAIASDTFERTVANGFGSAPTGGPWTVSTPSSSSVSAGQGRFQVGVGRGPTAYLEQVSESNSDVRVSFALDKLPSGSGMYFSVFPRRSGAGLYEAKARVTSSGALTVELDKRSSTGAQTALVSAVTVAGVTVGAGDAIIVRVQAIGTSPTLLRVKAWKVGSAEPTQWQRSISDSTGIQSAGSVGVSPYLSGSATSGVVVSIDDLLVTAAP